MASNKSEDVRLQPQETEVPHVEYTDTYERDNFAKGDLRALFPEHEFRDLLNPNHEFRDLLHPSPKYAVPPNTPVEDMEEQENEREFREMEFQRKLIQALIQKNANRQAQQLKGCFTAYTEIDPYRDDMQIDHDPFESATEDLSDDDTADKEEPTSTSCNTCSATSDGSNCQAKSDEEATGQSEKVDPEILRDEVLRLKAEGNDAYKSGDTELACDRYTEGLRMCESCPGKLDEERSVLLANRGLVKIKMGCREDAIADCSAALELNPTYFGVLLRRAQLYEQVDKPHDALKDYEKVLELDNRHPEALVAKNVRLPPLIEKKNEELKNEMIDNLKKLGNMVLNPFGLSTDNFNMVQDPKTGGYNVQFNQNK